MLIERKVCGEVAGDIRKWIGNEGLEFGELRTVIAKILESHPEKVAGNQKWEVKNLFIL